MQSAQCLCGTLQCTAPSDARMVEPSRIAGAPEERHRDQSRSLDHLFFFSARILAPIRVQPGHRTLSLSGRCPRRLVEAMLPGFSIPRFRGIPRVLHILRMQPGKEGGDGGTRECNLKYSGRERIGTTKRSREQRRERAERDQTANLRTCLGCLST